MKPYDFIDPHFSTVPWYRRPQPYVRWLLILAVIASAFAVIPDKPAPAPGVFAQDVPLAPVPLSALRDQPNQVPPITLTAPQDSARFVVNASESIDPEMVHRAPEGIDEAMVVRRPDRRAPSRIVVMPPRDKPGRLLPVPVLRRSDVPAAKIAPKSSANPPATAKPSRRSHGQRGAIAIWRDLPAWRVPAQPER
jgi:hypothetical protein